MAPADDPTQLDTEPHPAPRIAGLAAVGDRIGGYVVRDRAGAGGMAVVFRAHDPALDRDVALKLIAPQHADDPHWRARFLDESRAIAGLDHPNVVPVYARGEDEGRLFIAMRHVAGGTLHQRIRATGGLDAGEALDAIQAIAAALDAAHARGITHGDVKPGNVLLGGDPGTPHVYLSDFGLVARGAHHPGIIRPLGWAGTLGYAAPELIRTGRSGPATDIYALGCLLVEALTGSPPYTGDRPDVLAAHLTSPPPRVTDRVGGLPAELDAVVRRALAKHAADRYASAGDLARAARAATHPLVLLHTRQESAAADALALALAADGVTPWVQARNAPTDRATRNAVHTAAAVARLVGAGDPPPATAGAATVLLPGAVDGAREGTVIDLRAGLDDPDGRRRLLRLAGSETHAARDSAADCPYPGLAAYDEESAGMFVGREQDTDALLRLLGRVPVVFVTGPSGSGKSSLVRAGLVPAVRRHGLAGAADWEVTVTTPGAGIDPALLGPPAGSGRLVVLDQFEEVFDPEVPGPERDALMQGIGATPAHPDLRVVCIVRADFLARCAAHPALAPILTAGTFRVGTLSPAAVRRIAEEPAARAGLVLEDGLARRIVDDVAERPGSLPLLNHLLLELWRGRRGRTLTLEAYAASGGVEGALARAGNTVLHQVGDGGREVARRVLLRLVQPGEGTGDTRRRVPDDELRAAGPDDRVGEVVRRLTDARLVTTASQPGGGRTVEVAHEALIRGWGVLRAWVDADRDRLRAERRLTLAARDWADSGHDDAGLYRGTPLAEWTERGHDGLATFERDFLEASARLQDRLVAGARRRRRVLTGVALGVIAVLAGVSAVAVWQRGVARRERDRAQAQVLVLRARELLGADPAAAVVIARDAVRQSPGDDSMDALRRALAASPERAAIRTGDAELLALDTDGGGGVVTGDSRGRVVRWDPATARLTPVARVNAPVSDVAAGPGWVAVLPQTGRLRIITAGSPADPGLLPAKVRAVARSADAGRLVLADAAGAVVVLDTRRWRPVARLDMPGVQQVAVGPDGTVVGAAPDRIARWAPTAHSGPPAGAATLPGDDLAGLSVGADDRALVALVNDGVMLAWDGRGPAVRLPDASPQLPLAAAAGPTRVTNDVARDAITVRSGTGDAQVLPQSGETRAAVVSSTGDALVSAHNDGTLRTWDLSGLPRTVWRAATGTRPLMLDRTGARVLVRTRGGRLRLVGVAGGRARAVPGRGALAGVVSADGSTVLAVRPGVAVVHHVTGPPLRLPFRDPYDASLSDDGSLLALVDGARVRIHNAVTGRVVGRGPTGPDLIASAAFIPGSSDMVVATFRRTGPSRVRIARLTPATGRITRLFGPIAWPTQLTVSPGARVVAVASETAKAAYVWTAGTGRLRVQASAGRPVEAVAVSPDARMVAVGGADGRVGVWAADGSWALPGLMRLPGGVREVRIDDHGTLTALGPRGLMRRRCGSCGAPADVVRAATARITRDPVAVRRAASLTD